jgi:hypothetical protein
MVQPPQDGFFGLVSHPATLRHMRAMCLQAGKRVVANAY